MNLSSMRFKDYIWPHNPRVYEISYDMEIAEHRVPFGAYTLQQMGRRHRVLRGEGEFAGSGAYEEFRRLATVFYDMSPGVLVHPLWMTTRAVFASLRLRQEPTEDYVAYSFEFWECCDSYPGVITPTAAIRVTSEPPAAAPETAAASGTAAKRNTAAYVVTKTGETFWNVAKSVGQTVKELLEKNADIRNINEVGEEEKIHVS